MKILITLSALLLSPAAFAQPADFSSLVDSHLAAAPEKMHECLRTAWRATNASPEQNTQAREYMRAAKGVFEEHKDEIRTAMGNMKAAWKKHPIIQSEVVAAEAALHDHIVPVKTSFRDSGINVLNLLSNEQRTAFDGAFMNCLKDE